jgi:Tfp pilus assembly protein PilF
LDNEDAVAHLALAHAYSRLGEHDEAISAFEFATQLNPCTSSAHRELGNFLALPGRPEETAVSL